MKAVILAAGLGSRMAKKFPDIPKSMLPIKDKPLIQDQIEHLKKFGIKDFYINLHFQAKKIKKFLGDGSKLQVNITYSLEKKLLGTSGTLNNFRHFLNETFIVLYGDIYTRVDLDQFLRFHKRKKSPASILIHKTDHPEDSDLIETTNDKIINIYLSPHEQFNNKTNFSSAAIYILEPNILKFLKKGFSDFMEDFFPCLLKKKTNIHCYLSDEYTQDIGTPERYAKVKNDLLIL